MTPDQFSRFYKFVFHICKEPQRKHVSVRAMHDDETLMHAVQW